MNKPWTDAQDEMLKTCLRAGYTWTETADKMGRSFGSISSRIKTLKRQGDRDIGELTTDNFVWDSAADATLKQGLRDGKTHREIAGELDTTRYSVTGRIHRLKERGDPDVVALTETAREQREWTDWERAVVRELFPTVSSRVLADYLPKTDGAIRAEARRQDVDTDHLEVTQVYGDVTWVERKIAEIKARHVS